MTVLKGSQQTVHKGRRFWNRHNCIYCMYLYASSCTAFFCCIDCNGLHGIRCTCFGCVTLRASLQYTAPFLPLLPGLAQCQPEAPANQSRAYGIKQVNMPDGIPQELHGREADLHKALHDLLQQHHKVGPSRSALGCGAQCSIHAFVHIMIAS